MAAFFDTHLIFTGKLGAAAVMTCAAAIVSVNALTISALAAGGAP